MANRLEEREHNIGLDETLLSINTCKKMKFETQMDEELELLMRQDKD